LEIEGEKQMGLAQITSARVKIHALKKTNGSLTGQLNTSQARNNTLLNQRNIFQTRYQRLQKENKDLTERLKNEKNEENSKEIIRKLTEQRDQLASTLNQANKQVILTSETNKKLRKYLIEAEEEARGTQKKNDQLKKEIRVLKIKLTETQNKNRQLEESW
jgi:chromosome segregation ATPase